MSPAESCRSQSEGLGSRSWEGDLVATAGESACNHGQRYFTCRDWNLDRSEPRISYRPRAICCCPGSERWAVAQSYFGGRPPDDRSLRAFAGSLRRLLTQERHVERVQLPRNGDRSRRHEHREPGSRADEVRPMSAGAPRLRRPLPAAFPSTTRALAVPIAIFKTHGGFIARRSSDVTARKGGCR